jgi:hypothetical protein
MPSLRRQVENSGFSATSGIIGVDPGGTTGIFMLMMLEHITRRGVIGTYTAYRQVKRSDEPDAVVELLIHDLKSCDVPTNRIHVAIEKYVITRRTAKLTQQPDALEVTGAVKAAAQRHGVHVWQFTPSNAKKFASDDLLERIEWIPKRGMRYRHARDAARQVWTCLAEVDFPAWETIWSEQSLAVSGRNMDEIDVDEFMKRFMED